MELGITSAIGIQPSVISTSVDLSPTATLSLATSSMAIPPSGIQKGDPSTIASSADEMTFRLPQKRTYSQHLEAEATPTSFVPVSIGPNVLHIDVNDSMGSFSGASHSILVEGSYWQQQGPVSYVGLTKSDPYIKLVRSFTMELFKSGQLAQFVQVRKKGRSLLNGSPSSQTTTGTSMTGCDEATRSEQSEFSAQFDEPQIEEDSRSTTDSEVDVETEDALIVTRIQADTKISEPEVPVPQKFAFLPGIQSLKSISSSKTEYYSFVKESVLKILPRKRALHEAITRFFLYIAPLVPVFDKDTIIYDIGSVLHKNYPDVTDGFYTRLSIRNDNHLVFIGQLLLMIRLGYMSLISNMENELPYTAREQELIKDITRFKSDEYLNVVNLCIPEEKVQTKSTFKYVQGLVLLHFYRSVAPNDCFGLSGSDSQLLFGAIINHALSIGLNRDPVKYEEVISISKKPAFIKQWRLLWSYICCADALQAMYCGTPLKIPSLDISDVEKPMHDNLSVESALFFEQMDLMLDSYRRIINKITNLRTRPKVIDILQETSYLEKLFLEMFGTDFFRDYICKPAVEQDEPEFNAQKHEESFMKVFRFTTFMHMRANLSCLYYLIALHYEHKLDQDKNAEIGAGIELFKIFIRSVIQLVYIMSYVLDNAQELFGRSYDYIITSRIEKSMIKTHNFVTSFFIRLVNYKKSLAVEEDKRSTVKQDAESLNEDFDLRCEVVDSLFTIALIEAELFVGNFRLLSKTYINSYKLYVMAYFVLKQCMENPEKLFSGYINNKHYFHEGTNMLQFLTIAELQSLCKLCEEFRVAKLELVRRQKKRSKTQNLKVLVAKPQLSEEVSDIAQGPISSKMTDEDLVSAILDDNMEFDSSFDVATANRAMYANENTINTYGILQEKHMHSDFLKEVFDEQSMIGNEELLKLFELYGDLDSMMN